MTRACRWLRCIGSTDSTVWFAGITTSSECRCRTSPRMSAGTPTAATKGTMNEDPPVPDGPFRYQRYDERIHAPGLEDAAAEMAMMKVVEEVRQEQEKVSGKTGSSEMTQKMFRVI